MTDSYHSDHPLAFAFAAGASVFLTCVLAGGALIASDFFDSRSQAVRFVQVGVWCSLAGTVLFFRCLRRGHPAAARALLGSFLLLIATAVGLATVGFIRPHDRVLSLSKEEKVPLRLEPLLALGSRTDTPDTFKPPRQKAGPASCCP